MGRIRMPSVRSIATAMVISFVANAHGKIHWNFEKGQLRQSEIAQSITQTVDERTLTTSITIHTSSVVEEVNADGSALMTMNVARTIYSVTLPSGSTLVYDSSAGETPQGTLGLVAQALNPLVEWQAQVSIGTDGTILDVKSTQSPRPAGTPAGSFARMLHSQFAKLLPFSSFFIPNAELVEGATTVANENSILALGATTFASETTYTYRGKQEENGSTLDRFDVQTNVTVINPPLTESQPTSTTMPGVSISDQQSSGELLFDSNSSIVTRSKAEQALTLAYSIAGREVQQNIVVTSTRKSSIVKTEVPVEDQAASEKKPSD